MSEEIKASVEQAEALKTEPERRRESQATLLVRLAREKTELFHDGDDCYATMEVDQHHETHALSSKGFRRWLGRQFFDAHQSAPNGEAITAAINTLSGFARYQGREQQVHVRVADNDDRIYVDLADPDWRVIEVDAEGWRVIPTKSSPVRFRRAHGMEALQEPVHGGSVVALRPFLNLQGDDDFKLVLAWLVAALRGHGPYLSPELAGRTRLSEINHGPRLT